MTMTIMQKHIIFIWLVITCGLTHLLDSVQAINILGIVTSLSKSHSVLANSIFDEYANSGHSVTVLSPYEVSPKINHYKLDGLHKVKKNLKSNMNINADSYTAMLQNYEEGITMTRTIVNHESFKRLISSSLNINVIILDYDLNDAMLGIVHYFKCPILIITTDPQKLSLKRLLGYSYPLANLIFNEPPTYRSLTSYLQNILSNMYEKFIVDFYYLQQQESVLQGITQDSSVSLQALSKRSIAKVFTNSLSKPSLITPNIIDISGFHIPEKSMFDYLVSDRLDRFIHSSDEGCIYVSLGSDTDPTTLPKEKILKLFQVFNSRPEKVIWSWNGNTTIFEGSSKFFIHNWLPQDDILRHRNIKAFITNGGVLSLQETIYHEIPIIGIPLTHDQLRNVNGMVEKGLGVKIEFNNITMVSLNWALSEVLDNNESYKQKLGQESELMRNHVISPAKILKYWISFIHQHRHEKLENSYRLSAIDYYLADIYLHLVIIFSIFFALAVILFHKFQKPTMSHSFFEEKLKLY